MANFKEQNPNLTHEQQRDIVGELMKKHGLENAEGVINTTAAAKAGLLAEAARAFGMGRNETTVNALRFVADLFESEIASDAQKAAEERAKREALAIDLMDISVFDGLTKQ